MKIYLLDLGSLVIDRSDVLWHIDVGTPVRFPVYGVYIDHPEGKFIFDTGYDLEHVNAVLPFELPEQTPQQTLPEQLKLCGTTPDEIDYFVNSHFHFDHVGGNKYLTNATLITSQVRAALAAGARAVRAPRLLGRGLVRARPTKVKFVEGDYQLAEGLTLFNTPGHTIAHISLLAEPEGRRPMIFAGDAVYTQETLDKEIIGGFHLDPAQSVEAIRRIKEMARAARRGHLPVARDGDLGDLEARPRVLRGLRRRRHMGKLDGRVAIVTGGAQGIGRAIVDKLAEEGATVVIGDIDADKAEAAAAGGLRPGRGHRHRRAGPGRPTWSTPPWSATASSTCSSTTRPSCPSPPGTTSTSPSGAG